MGQSVVVRPDAALIVMFLLAAALWLLVGTAVAAYAQRRGHPWLPVFLAAIFVSAPLTLLLVALAGDRPGGDGHLDRRY
jgi:hypothetical protein